MKKITNIYLILWICGLVLFNIVAFVVPSENKFENINFWIGYGLTTLIYVSFGLLGYSAFKPNKKEKLFLNIPLFKITLVTLLITIILQTVLVAITIIPTWISSIASLIILLIYLIATFTSRLARDVVSQIDEEILEETSFMKNLEIEVKLLYSKIENENIKSSVNKVLDVVKYSDYRSNKVVNDLEKEISNEFIKYKELSLGDDANRVLLSEKNILSLLEERALRLKNSK